ncbi:MAG: hypothetical protein R2941_24310 [Desulfobacterales bacterium]
MFRYFTERAGQFVRKRGRVGLVVPCTLWQGQGCTGLPGDGLFEKCTMLRLYTFENYRKWAFGIDSRFKFSTFLLSARSPENHGFSGKHFMLRDAQVLAGGLPERVVNLSRDYIRIVNPFVSGSH